jgi:PIN domain nuclease of toxin-antitoxin system
VSAYRERTPSDWLDRLPHVEDLGPMPRAKLYSAALTVSTLAGVALVARSGSIGTALCTSVCPALPALVVASAYWSIGKSMGSTAVGLDGLVRDRDHVTSWNSIVGVERGADGRSKVRRGGGHRTSFVPVDDRLSVEQAERLCAVIELVAQHVPRPPLELESIEQLLDQQPQSQPPPIVEVTSLVELRAQLRDELTAMDEDARWAFRAARRAKLALPAVTPAALVLAAFELAQCDDPSDRALIAECSRRCAWGKTVRALEVLASDAPERTPLYEVLGRRAPSRR